MGVAPARRRSRLYLAASAGLAEALSAAEVERVSGENNNPTASNQLAGAIHQPNDRLTIASSRIRS